MFGCQAEAIAAFKWQGSWDGAPRIAGCLGAQPPRMQRVWGAQPRWMRECRGAADPLSKKVKSDSVPAARLTLNSAICVRGKRSQ